jgi:hypothetical protein
MNRNFVQCTEYNIDTVLQNKPALVYHLRDVGGVAAGVEKLQ